jgi:hypothetical protein
LLSALFFHGTKNDERVVVCATQIAPAFSVRDTFRAVSVSACFPPARRTFAAVSPFIYLVIWDGCYYILMDCFVNRAQIGAVEFFNDALALAGL